jgi:hypothetical protein
VVKQNVAGVDLFHDMAGFIDDLDAAVQPDLPFAQQGMAQVQGFFPGGFGIGQFLALAVAGQDSAFTNMEKIAGHGLGFAELFLR